MRKALAGTPSALIPAACIAVACILVASALVGCTQTDDDIVGGRFSPDDPVSLTNLTVTDGRYLVAYSLDVFISSQTGRVELACSVIDTSGRLAELPGLVRTIETGSWQRVEAQDTFELPDLTLGVRCYPDRDATLTVVVRDVQLTAQNVD